MFSSHIVLETRLVDVSSSFFQPPAVIAVIDHLMGHAAVDTASDALSTSRYDGYFILERIHNCSFCWVT